MITLIVEYYVMCKIIEKYKSIRVLEKYLEFIAVYPWNENSLRAAVRGTNKTMSLIHICHSEWPKGVYSEEFL